MKKARQAKIIELIQKNEIETQEELQEKLYKEGINTTQATISRDIRELRLKKTTGSRGKQVYIPDKKTHVSNESYKQVLGAGIISITAAENLIVIKTMSGVAMAVAAALDDIEIEGLLGSIAGDDTIFLAVQNKELCGAVMDKIKKMANNIL